MKKTLNHHSGPLVNFTNRVYIYLARYRPQSYTSPSESTWARYRPQSYTSPSESTWASFCKTFFFFFLPFLGALASSGGSFDGRPEAGRVSSKSSSLLASTTSPIGSGLLDRYEYSLSDSLFSSSFCNFFFLGMLGKGRENDSESRSDCLRDFLKDDFFSAFPL